MAWPLVLVALPAFAELAEVAKLKIAPFQPAILGGKHSFAAAEWT
jgi:hypothetical protein